MGINSVGLLIVVLNYNEIQFIGCIAFRFIFMSVVTLLVFVGLCSSGHEVKVNSLCVFVVEIHH